MKIIKNSIGKKEAATIRETLIQSQFPWYYNEGKVYTKAKHKYDFQFCHTFYTEFSVRSPQFFYLLNPILEVLKPDALQRIKANLNPVTDKTQVFDYHTDHDIKKNFKTAIYYVNTNNGYTLFPNGKKITSEENKLVVFDSQTKHCGTTCTDKENRIVINFNYI